MGCLLMGERKEGLTAAVEAIGVGELEPAGEQIELLEIEEPETPLPLAPARTAGPKGGRPKGARNRRTEEWVRYILGRYRSPLVALAETWSRRPRELAEELELFHRDPETGAPLRDLDGKPILREDAVLEAFRIQQAAMVAALPYLHQKQPLAVAVSEEKRGLLVIGNLAVEGTDGDGDGLALPLAEGVENQRVIDITPEKSDIEKSDDGAK